MISHINLHAVLTMVLRIAEQADTPVFLVGGVVRDLISGRPLSYDFDFTISGDALAFVSLFAETYPCTVREHQRFRTATVRYLPQLPNSLTLDFVSARKERYLVPGALPVVEPGTLEQDLARRDFSINSLALAVTPDILNYCNESSPEIFVKELRNRVLDFHQGVLDLDRRLVRILHRGSFIDDPTRIFRAARYATRIGGALEGQTLEQLRNAMAADVFASISRDRIWRELRLIFDEAEFLAVGDLLMEWGVFEALALPPYMQVCRRITDQLEVLLHKKAVPIEFLAIWEYQIVCESAPADQEQAVLDMGFGKKWLKRLSSQLQKFEQRKLSDIDEALLLYLFTTERANQLHEEICLQIAAFQREEGQAE